MSATVLYMSNETDLEKFCEDLGEVVDETMQPSHVSLWLSSPSTNKVQGHQEQQTTRHED